MESSVAPLRLKVAVDYRQILSIFLPISASMLVPQLNFVTNNIFLGMLSEQALAVAGITGVYYLIFAAIGMGLNSGLQALISRRAGEERKDQISRLFHQGVFLSLAIAAFGILLTYIAAPFIFKLVLHDHKNVEMALGFLSIRIWGLPVLYVYQMRNALLVGINKSRFLVIGTLAETLTNILMDYALIYGHLGFPVLGFNGAAYASIIAELVGLIFIFGIMRVNGIVSELRLFTSIRFDPVNARLLFKQAAPLMLQFAFSLMTWQFFYILVEHHGARDLAISNAMRNIFGIFGFIAGAFGAVSNTMVSNVIGQGKTEQVIPVIKKILQFSVGLSLIVCILLNIFPHVFLMIYGQDTTFISEGIPVVRVVSSALVIAAFASVCLNAIVGTGNSRINLYIELIGITFYGLFAYLTLEVLQLPIAIGWMAEWIFWLTMFTASALYLKSGKWKGKKL
jgi:multidrug resistance protein, MATE family